MISEKYWAILSILSPEVFCNA